MFVDIISIDMPLILIWKNFSIDLVRFCFDLVNFGINLVNFGIDLINFSIDLVILISNIADGNRFFT